MDQSGAGGSPPASPDSWHADLVADLAGLERRLRQLVALATERSEPESIIDSLQLLSTAARDVAEQLAARQIAAGVETVDTGERAGHRLLLVTDDVDAGHVLGLQLELLGFEVVREPTAERALHTALAEDRIEVVLTDLRLPNMQGDALTRALRAMPPHRNTPVVIFTNDRSADAAQLALDSGADDFVRKPVRADELAARLRHAVVTSRRRQASDADVQRLEQLADSDPLTGLPNRRAVTEAASTFEAALTRPGGERHQVAVVLIDVDRFKEINDDLGHDAGDVVLCAVATALRGVERAADVAGRWGGDEFVIVARDISLDGLETFAKRIVRRVRDETVAVGHAHSVSVGAALGIVGDGGPSLFGEADAALYEAKHQGRDRAVVVGVADTVRIL